MSRPDPFGALRLRRGPAWPNRLALAALTNQQSHPDGTISDAELRWLVLRAEGGFGLTMTCASHVQAVGQGFPGQLGVFGDQHADGLARLASAIVAAGSVPALQLHHAGARAPAELVGQPVGPSDDAATGTRALTAAEVEDVVDDFAAAAARAERAGFAAVEVHGAHGYLLCQFLSPEQNRRTDRYGGSPGNRARIVVEVLDAIRDRCSADLQVGIRLSPERFGLRLADIRDLAGELLAAGRVDFLDMSLWDARKLPEDATLADRPLLAHFTDLERGDAVLGVAGTIRTGRDVVDVLTAGADYAIVGRAAVLHHDFPRRLRRDRDFTPVALPVSEAYLHGEGVSPPFVDYLRRWEGFVAT